MIKCFFTVLLLSMIACCVILDFRKIVLACGRDEHFDTMSVDTMSINIPQVNDTTVGNCGAGKCSADKCGVGNLHPVMDPRYNMREVSKQCILLEDHLNNTKKRCFDCIRKHFLTVDGFLEEAVSLEPDIELRAYYRSLYLYWVSVEKKYAINPRDSANLDEISKTIRTFRKPLVEKYFDLVSEYNEE